MKIELDSNDILKMVKNMMEFPFPQICVHLVATDLLQILESHGFEHDNYEDLVREVVYANNEDAIQLINKLANK